MTVKNRSTSIRRSGWTSSRRCWRSLGGGSVCTEPPWVGSTCSRACACPHPCNCQRSHPPSAYPFPRLGTGGPPVVRVQHQADCKHTSSQARRLRPCARLMSGRFGLHTHGLRESMSPKVGSGREGRWPERLGVGCRYHSTIASIGMDLA